MADPYPTSVPVDNATRLVASDDIQVDTAADGTVRGRVSFANTLYTARVVHSYISSTDRTAVLNHYAAWKTDPFTFTYDGDNYTMRYASHPQQMHMSGDWWRVDVALIGTKG